MPDEVYARVGDAIRRKREARGMTQAALASKVNLARTSITSIEAGVQAVQLHHLLLIAEALFAKPSDLLPERLGALNHIQDEIGVNENFDELLNKLTGFKA